MPDHKDILGNQITVEAAVVVPVSKSCLEVGIVRKLTPKMITVTIVGKARGWSKGTRQFYPGDVLVIEDAKVTMYILKQRAL